MQRHGGRPAGKHSIYPNILTVCEITVYFSIPKALDNINFWVGGPNLGTVHGEKQPSLYFLCGPLPPRTQFHFQNRLSPFFAQLEAAGTFVGKNAAFQFPSHNSPTLWIEPLKLCGVFGNTVAPGRKIPI